MLRVSGSICAILTMVACAWPGAASATPGEQCHDQAIQAEHDSGIPEGLLLAIGKRESGRRDGVSGSTLPWPWAVNVDGNGRSFDSLPAAIAYVIQSSAGGARSIDVGCMQISLLYHPDAFATLEEAFDPALNTAYSAKFLSSLHATLGTWEAAVAAYHSADPARGGPYRDQVYATWQGRVPDAVAAPAGQPVWGIHIWIPGDTSIVQVSARARRLPTVITPHAGLPGRGS